MDKRNRKDNNMCNCHKKQTQLYQELAQTMDMLIREHKAYKRQRKAIVDAINELADHVEEHEAILDEIYQYLAAHSQREQEQHKRRHKARHNRQHQERKRKMHRCDRCGR